MLKKLLLTMIAMSIIAQFKQPARGADAFCVIECASSEIQFCGNCIFEQFGGNGSFSIKSPSNLIVGRLSISVSIIESNIAEVRGLTTNGINSRWGQARKSSSDTACWVGIDFKICAY